MPFSAFAEPPAPAAQEPDDIIPAKETYPRNYVGRMVRFFLRRRNGKETKEKGEVIEQRFLGLTVRGKIPEWEVRILGRSGTNVLARVTRDHVVPI